jgi:predicted HicB family RNase H-like nuclease
MTTMIFKGYTARIDYDGDDDILTGWIAGIADIVGFHADTADGLKAAFEEAVEDYIQTCAKAGER